MISSAPQTVKNNFSKELRQVTNEDRFQSVKRFYDLMQKGKIPEKPKSNDLNLLKKYNEEASNWINGLTSYRNMDDRLDHSRYFYFPTEFQYGRMNCFEKSASMYFALKEIYPKSNPALTYLFFENDSIHVTTLFTHNRELYAADPNFHTFGKVYLRDDSYIIPLGKDKKEDLENSNWFGNDDKDGKKELSFKFKDIRKIDEHILDLTANQLRRDSGIVNFVYKSGQIVADSGILTSQKLFMYITEENNIVSETRMGNHCIRTSFNPITNEQEFDLVHYKSPNWRTLDDEKKIIIPGENPYESKGIEGKVMNYYPAEGIAYFLQNKMPFSEEELNYFESHPIVQKRFGKFLDTAKNYEDKVYNRFIEFLRFKFGVPEQIVPMKTSQEVTFIGEDKKEVTVEMPLNETSFEEMYLKENLNCIQFASDAERYTEEAAKQIVG